ncbi:hypothetical protein BBJ28_00021682 [Nothophytophthora sp. Chile5]|nr:hypothetical protein BBJ28_00021682 [Nothophytophthora sp. Chile5]
MSLIRYAFFKPEVLGTPGYAYGSYQLPEDLSAPVVVALICNGRWGGRAASEVDRPRAEVEARAVCEAEASSGIGTYTGSCICAARIPPGAARLWDYGIVVGFEWFEESASGLFHVQFGTTTETLLFDEGQFQEVAVETYALRPCFHRAVADIMPGEMTAINHAAFVHFNGIGKTAARSSRAILQKLGMAPVDEALSVPLYDALRSRVVEVPINAAIPPVALPLPTRLTVAVDDQLSDSEEDSDGEPGVSAPTPDPAVAPGPPKRRRVQGESGEPTSNLARLQAATASHADQPGMLRELDEFISLRQASLSQSPGSGLVLAPSATGSAAQFRPSALQQTVHQAIVNGTFSAYPPQLLVETLQSQCEFFSFLPHPAVLRGLYAWDFGMRGLSVMHFARVTTQHQRELTRRFDMTDFSLKTRLPDPSRPGLLDDLLEALDGLFSVVNHCCKMFVGELLQAARGFLCQLRSSTSPPDAVVLQEFVHWVDGRLERFRALLARGDEETAATVKLDFCVSHPSYIRILQDATQMHLAEIRRAAAQPQGESLRRHEDGRHQGRGRIHQGARQQVPTVPPSVLQALPSLNGKSLCMKFLAVNTCRGRGDGCVFDYRGHFRPIALDPQVRAFIVQNYGGLKPEFKDL